MYRRRSGEGRNAMTLIRAYPVLGAFVPSQLTHVCGSGCSGCLPVFFAAIRCDLPGLIPLVDISSAVSHSQTSPGAGKAKEKKNYKRNQAPDCDIFRDGTTSAHRSRRLIWATCLIRRRRTLILRLGLVGIGLRRGSAAERRATICAKVGAIRIRQSTVWAVH